MCVCVCMHARLAASWAAGAPVATPKGFSGPSLAARWAAAARYAPKTTVEGNGFPGPNWLPRGLLGLLQHGMYQTQQKKGMARQQLFMFMCQSLIQGPEHAADGKVKMGAPAWLASEAATQRNKANKR
eukprot:scaffold55082_cov17-Tisochrysis_lutea.AAC.1